jgi:hypothetical protein
MVLLFTLVKLLMYSLILFYFDYLDVFSRRYIKSLELLHDCDETEGNDGDARHSMTSCSLRKSSQVSIDNSESSHQMDHKKHS